MLGSHPNAVFTPELNLVLADRMDRVLEAFRLSDAGYEAGLLRLIGALFYGEQSIDSAKAGRDWLQRRRDAATETVLWEIAEKVAPRQLVIPETLSPLRPDLLNRLQRFSPDSQWLHLVQHPRIYAEQVVYEMTERLFVPPDFKDFSHDPPMLDPQVAWLRIHGHVEYGFSSRPGAMCRRVRYEDVQSEPEEVLGALCEWAGWHTDPATLERMLHPEFSVFACKGPPGAVGGIDPGFMRDPFFTRALRPIVSLEGPLPWRSDGMGFSREVRARAEEYGYR
jgi:hypothetical protein